MTTEDKHREKNAEDPEPGSRPPSASGADAAQTEGDMSVERKQRHPGPVFDAVFRTVIARLGRLLILLVNQVFGTDFAGDEEIVYGTTEITERTAAGGSRVIRADSHFTIVSGNGEKRPFHIECHLRKDGTILFRIAEYDMMLALQHAGETDWGWEFELPASAVILLRSSEKKKDCWKYRIRNSDGSFIDQEVKTLYLPELSVDSLFDDDLYALLPFYLFTYGGKLRRLEETPEGRASLLEDEKKFQERLMKTEELTESEKIRLLELTLQVFKNVVQDRKLKEEVNKMMRAGIIELESDKFAAAKFAEGKAEGIAEGRAEAKTEVMYDLVRDGLISAAAAAQKLGITEEQFQREMSTCEPTQ